jgi:predicted secreted protein
MAKIKSFGIGVTVATNAIGGLTDVGLPGVDVSMIDTTTHDSTGGFREYVSGLKDAGSLELTGKYDYANTGQAHLRTNPGASATFVVTFSDGTKATFTAFIGGYVVTNPLDDSTEFSCSCKITGGITWAAS